MNEPRRAPLATSLSSGLPGWLMAMAAIAALAFLSWMVYSGSLPRQRQLVQFEARGPMQVAPEAIARIELQRGRRSAVLLRRGTDWIDEQGAALLPDSAKRISMAVQFLHNSGPIRHLTAEEISGRPLSEFGLEVPRLSATLHDASGPVIAVHFGAQNPEATAQYMQIDGRPGLYLMSRFVGAEWDAAAQFIGVP